MASGSTDIAGVWESEDGSIRYNSEYIGIRGVAKGGDRRINPPEIKYKIFILIMQHIGLYF